MFNSNNSILFVFDLSHFLHGCAGVADPETDDPYRKIQLAMELNIMQQKPQ